MYKYLYFNFFLLCCTCVMQIKLIIFENHHEFNFIANMVLVYNTSSTTRVSRTTPSIQTTHTTIANPSMTPTGSQSLTKIFILRPLAKFWFKTAHNTWIKYLKSEENSLIMKIVLKFNECICPKSRQFIFFLWKYDFQKIISVSCNKSLQQIRTHHPSV